MKLTLLVHPQTRLMWSVLTRRLKSPDAKLILMTRPKVSTLDNNTIKISCASTHYGFENVTQSQGQLLAKRSFLGGSIMLS